MSGEDEGILARWSRLKQQDAATPIDQVDRPPDASAPVAGHGDEGAAATPQHADETSGEAVADDGRLLTEDELPDIESLTFESDFSVFMKRNVPLQLQKRALRKLWLSSPVLANLDGLNDHDLDYTIAEMKDIAAQSAADLASGVKRLNVVDLRAKEREMRRAAAARPPSRPSEPRPEAAEVDATAVDAAQNRPEGLGDAETELVDFVESPSRRLDS